MSEAAYDKPMPPLNRDSKPYWDSLQEGSMRLQSCANCGKVRHYPRPVCDSCHSFEVEWVRASGKGKVHRFRGQVDGIDRTCTCGPLVDDKPTARDPPCFERGNAPGDAVHARTRSAC